MSTWKLRLAKKIIDRGGIIAYPTESVYGLGCDPLNYDAVKTLCLLKKRPLSKGLILIASHLEQLQAFTQLSPAQQKILSMPRPKPTTWIVPASKNCPHWLRGQHEGIAVRLTQHPLAQQLCQLTGHALISTSANISQQAAAKNAFTTRRIFGETLDIILHAETGHCPQPSEIININNQKIIRHG